MEFDSKWNKMAINKKIIKNVYNINIYNKIKSKKVNRK